MWNRLSAVPRHQLLFLFFMMINVHYLNAGDFAIEELTEPLRKVSQVSTRDESLYRNIDPGRSVRSIQSNDLTNIIVMKGRLNSESMVLFGEKNKGCFCNVSEKQISSMVSRVEALEKKMLDQNDQTTQNIQQALAGPGKQFSDIRNEMNVIRGRLDQEENTSSQLAQKISVADKKTEDILQRISGEEAVLKSLEMKVSQLQRGLQDKSITVSQLAQEVNDLRRSIGENVLRPIQKLEAAYEAMEKKFTASLNSEGEYIQTITNVKPDLEDLTCTYTPIMTRQFGYKLEVCFRSDGDKWYGDVRMAAGDYDNVLKWPFRGKLTFTLYDQSEQPENHIYVWEAEPNVCGSFWTRSGIGGACVFFIVSKEKMRTRQYVKNNTMYFGVKIIEL